MPMKRWLKDLAGLGHEKKQTGIQPGKYWSTWEDFNRWSIDDGLTNDTDLSDELYRSPKFRYAVGEEEKIRGLNPESAKTRQLITDIVACLNNNSCWKRFDKWSNQQRLCCLAAAKRRPTLHRVPGGCAQNKNLDC